MRQIIHYLDQGFQILIGLAICYFLLDFAFYAVSNIMK